MKKIKQSRMLSFVIILVVYMLAFAAGMITFIYIPETGMILRLFIADCVATVIVWAFGVCFGNSSMYDPYWSVAPPLILTPLAVSYGAFNIPTLLVLLAVWIWGVRLTVNWAYTFKNLSVQDWRYDKYKRETGIFWPVVNFFGINLMPTVVVFLAMIPAFQVIMLYREANVWTYAGFALSLLAVVLQGVSDWQAHRFRRLYPGQLCNQGLWRVSRHPNYLGEILMWWGIYAILLSLKPEDWASGIGALVNTCLFVFISIPLMEKRQLANKAGYASYRAKTGMLFPKF